jgi:heat shock protein HslJ
VQIGNRVLRGCGGHPAGIIRGDAWTIDSLNGRPPVPGSNITIQFAADGSVAGTAGCNRYRGNFVVRGGELVIGPAMSTKMACNPDVDGQESRFLAAIAEPLVFYVEQGVLHMTRDNNTVATARRR